MSRTIYVLSMVLLLFQCSEGLPSHRNTNDTDNESKEEPFYLEYLEKYGYLEPLRTKGKMRVTQSEIAQALKMFQNMAGIPTTGLFDVATNETMLKPRCGVKDIEKNASNTRVKRYSVAGVLFDWTGADCLENVEKEDIARNEQAAVETLIKFYKSMAKGATQILRGLERERIGTERSGLRWKKSNLTYRFTKYTNDVDKDRTEREIKKAFDKWSKYIPLNFIKNDEGLSDIEIAFAKGKHGDSDAFDGPGNVLAHAFFPQLGFGHFDGDIHFDDDEDWAVGQKYGATDIHVVALHEIGHSLGLGHSHVEENAIMYPIYTDYNSNPELHEDDIKGIQSIYGIRSPVEAIDQTTSTTTGKPEPAPVFCKNAALDAITSTQNGTTFVFKGNYYYQIQYVQDRFVLEHPHPIHDWANISGPIDAAFTWDMTGITFLFKGEHYWKFNNTDFIHGPRLISKGFRGIPNHVDTVFAWSGNGQIYFIKGDQYWRFNTYIGMADSNYPRPISVWRGLPSKIDAALKLKYAYYDWKTYFFSGHNYYEFSDREFSVNKNASTAKVWFGCPDKNAAASYMATERDLQDIKAGGDFFEYSLFGGSKIITIDMNLLVLMIWSFWQ